MNSRRNLTYERVSLNEIKPERLEEIPTSYQPKSSVTRKPLRSVIRSVEVAEGESIESTKKSGAIGSTTSKRGFHWITPLSAILLWLIGFAAAAGHSFFLRSLKEKPVGNQIWTLRYSLALAFIFKSALGASISIALVQYVWFTLRHSKTGTSITTIDAMFLSGSSLPSIASPALWRSATLTGFIALCTWLMPLTALVSPTALTVGTDVLEVTRNDCIVPTLDWSVQRDFTKPTGRRSLFVTDNSDQYLRPSTISERLTASVLGTGHQIGWPSPCGPNCTYDIQFSAPSWQCTTSEDVDDPSAPWQTQTPRSYWYWGDWGDGSNITVTAANSNSLLYSPVYYGGLNASTNQFWTGFAAGFVRGLDVVGNLSGSSLREILNVQAYSCQVANSSYTIRVSYSNGIQENTILDIGLLTILDIPPEGWNERSLQNVPIPFQDVIGMYMPMIDMLSGYINRDPRYELVTNTSLGQVPTLIDNLSINVTYASETPYLPRSDLGPLLQELSQNLTISLMSIPLLLVTSSEMVSCQTSLTMTVWKVDWTPLFISYSIGLGMSMVCLMLGTRALVANRGAYDTSFSSVVRTTRDKGFNDLIERADVGTLPVSPQVAKQKLKFVDETPAMSEQGEIAYKRSGFKLHD